MHLYELSEEEQLELIGIKEDEDKVYYPTMSVCSYCGGLVEICRLGEESIDDPQLAYEIALVQYGSNLNDWDSNVANRRFVPHPCTCECPVTGERHDSEIVEDDGMAITIKCKDCGKKVERGYK